MRINAFVAQATGWSRRSSDEAIASGRVTVNGQTAVLGQQVAETDEVAVDGKPLSRVTNQTILLHKPVGYVVSRDGQGSKTVYDLLPPTLQQLKPIGRLDKDSSGLLLLTNDGQLAETLTHPKYHKQKVYEVTLNKPLSEADQRHIEAGVQLADGPSSLQLMARGSDRKSWRVSMNEGRNRQIRRTFEAVGNTVTTLHRTQFGEYRLETTPVGQYVQIPTSVADMLH